MRFGFVAMCLSADGSGTSNWTDSTVGQDLGTVVIDGTAKTVRLGSNVAATDVTIGADDTLDANGSNTKTKTGYINVTQQSGSAPVADFSASPLSGKKPLQS